MKIALKIILILLFIIEIHGQKEDTTSNHGKYELVDIKFEGNRAFSSSTLFDVISSKTTPWWVWKFLNSFTSLGQAPVYYDSSNTKNDLRSIEAFYNNYGYFEAKVRHRIEVNEEEKEIALIFELEENDPSLFNHVELHGLSKVHIPLVHELNMALTMDKTKIYNEDVLKESINGVMISLGNNGYLTARFDSTVIVRDTIVNVALMDIYFNVGRRYQVSEVMIDKRGPGAEYVEDDMLKRIVGIKEYDYYSVERNRQSQVRLFRTGLFSNVTVAPSVADTFGSFVPLKISGNIGMMNELAPEIVVNNQQNAFTLGGGGSYIRKNFFGGARKFQLTGLAGVKDIFNTNVWTILKRFTVNDTTLQGYLEARMKIEQPYVFNRPIFGILESYFKVEKDIISDRKSYGGKLSLEYEMPRYTFITGLTTYYNLEVVDEKYYLHKILSELSGGNFTLQYQNTLSTLGADVKSSKTDDPLFPTSGYNLSFMVEETNGIPYLLSKLGTAEYAEASFYKGLVTYANYYSLNKKRSSIFAQKIKLGFLQAYRGDQMAIPTTRKFYSGGSNSIRGWRSQELSPVQLVQSIRDSLLNISLVSSGGTLLIEGSTEYRWRFLENAGLSIFADYGNVFNGVGDFAIEQIAVAAGLGFRYYTQIAPFRIDFGFKVIDPNDRRSFLKKPFFSLMEFHFGIGEAF